MSGRTTIKNRSDFLSLYAEGLSDWKIGLVLGVSRDTVYRLRHKLDASGLLPPRTRKTSESNITHKTKSTGEVVLSACSEVELMLKDKTDEYRLGFEDGVRWRLALSAAKTNGR
jgi:transposase